MKAGGANKGCVEGLDTDPLAKRSELVPCRCGKWNSTQAVLFGKGFVLRVEGLSEDVLSLRESCLKSSPKLLETGLRPWFQ